MERHAKRIAELLKVLANENRLVILCALMRGPQNVSSLLKKVQGISQPALSQHLAMMKAHGILSDRRAGQTVTYRIADQRVERVIEVLGASYCPGGAIDGAIEPAGAEWV
jgi:DNA-binding transcriptional ArsR family regulator